MAEHSTAVAHQFDDAEQQQEASIFGMWIFLVTEVMFFGGMFAGYTVYRYKYFHEFTFGSHKLDLMLGGINTVVLIASSLTMALAVRAAQTNKRQQIILFLILTMVLGSVFLGIKVEEYSHKFHENFVPGAMFAFRNTPQQHAELYFSFYFAMTGFHALHMIIGVGLLAVILRMAVKGRFSADYYNPVEVSGLYWHFVDIVWIFLFPLLYLIR